MPMNRDLMMFSDQAGRHGTGSAAILLVEDDRDSREALAAFVESLGYMAVEADTGEAAVRVIESDRDLAMVLSDVRMPGMSGIELLERVRKTRPALKVVLITGDPPSIDDALARDAIPVLKPYDFSILERVISDTLNNPRNA